MVWLIYKITLLKSAQFSSFDKFGFPKRRSFIQIVIFSYMLGCVIRELIKSVLSFTYLEHLSMKWSMVSGQSQWIQLGESLK